LKYPNVATHVETLQKQIRSISRHAGGILFADNINEKMPLIKSGDVVQTPWSEGQTVRHLEPLGFIKFDILALSTLEMVDTCIRHILRNHMGVKNPTFGDVKKFYNDKLHPNSIDLNDQSVYEYVFQQGNFCGTFQFTNPNAQKFCMDAKPTNIVDIAAITSIYRPGPLSANVHTKYVEAKNNPEGVEYVHPLVKEVAGETFGFLVFQEQLSLLAHKLGKDISLDEGNELRKVLTKKGTGKEAAVKEKLYGKFIEGCTDKGITEEQAVNLWKNMEFFSGYGFNLSHAVCYSILSYQCAYLFKYYPAEWLAAFLDKEPEERKESAIALVKTFVYAIKKLNINSSGVRWEVDSTDSKTLIQPLSSVKGLGDTAITEIMKARPFKTVEEVLFNESITYSKLNKRALDALVRCGAMSDLMDSRFTGTKHMWSAIVVDRPKTKKKLDENIEKYKPEGDFTAEEKIEHMTALTGVYPINLVMPEDVLLKLEKKNISPIGQFDETLEQDIVWFIPRNKEIKLTKKGKPYWIISVTDNTNSLTTVKCWSIKENDVLHINRPYMGQISKDGYGYSIRSFKDQVRLLA
jgi:DNA polymerase-3 subunit alpha